MRTSTIRTLLYLAIALKCTAWTGNNCADLPFTEEHIPPCDVKRHNIRTLLADSIVPLLKRNGYDNRRDLLEVEFTRNDGYLSSDFEYLMSVTLSICDNPLCRAIMANLIWQSSEGRIYYTDIDGVTLYVNDQTHGIFTQKASGKGISLTMCKMYMTNDNEVDIAYLVSDSALLHLYTRKVECKWPGIDNFDLFNVTDSTASDNRTKPMKP